MRFVKLGPYSQRSFTSDVNHISRKWLKITKRIYRLWEVTPGMCPKLTVPGHRGCDQLTGCIYKEVHFTPNVQEFLF